MKYFLIGRFQCAWIVLLELIRALLFVLFELIRALHFSVHRLFRALFAQICKVFSVRESMILKIQDMLIRLINQLQKMSWFFFVVAWLVLRYSEERAGENTQLVLATNLIHLLPIFCSKFKQDVKKIRFKKIAWI